MWLIPPSPLPFHPSCASSSPRRGCLPCWDNDGGIWASSSTRGAGSSLLPPGELCRAAGLCSPRRAMETAAFEKPRMEGRAAARVEAVAGSDEPGLALSGGAEPSSPPAHAAARRSCQLPLRPSVDAAVPRHKEPLFLWMGTRRTRRCVGSDPSAGMFRCLILRATSEGGRDPRGGSGSSSLPGPSRGGRLCHPGPCCRMSHRAGTGACNDPVSIPPSRGLSVADGSGPCVPPGWDSTR